MYKTSGLFLSLWVLTSLLSNLMAQNDSTVKIITKHKPVYKYKFIGDGLWTEGNVSRKLGSIRTDLGLNTEVIELFLAPRITYGEQNEELKEREYFTDLQFNVFYKKPLYLLTFGIAEQSHLRAIDFRYQAGGGLGLHILRKPLQILSVTNAVIYEETDFTEKETIKTLRNTARLKGKHHIIKDKLLFLHQTFFQPSLYDTRNYRWNTQLILEIPLSQHIHFRSSMESSYESIVAEGRKNKDSRFTVGIAIGNH